MRLSSVYISKRFEHETTKAASDIAFSLSMYFFSISNYRDGKVCNPEIICHVWPISNASLPFRNPLPWPHGILKFWLAAQFLPTVLWILQIRTYYMDFSYTVFIILCSSPMKVTWQWVNCDIIFLFLVAYALFLQPYFKNIHAESF